MTLNNPRGRRRRRARGRAARRDGRVHVCGLGRADGRWAQGRRPLLGRGSGRGSRAVRAGRSRQGGRGGVSFCSGPLWDMASTPEMSLSPSRLALRLVPRLSARSCSSRRAIWPRGRARPVRVLACSSMIAKNCSCEKAEPLRVAAGTPPRARRARASSPDAARRGATARELSDDRRDVPRHDVRDLVPADALAVALARVQLVEHLQLVRLAALADRDAQPVEVLREARRANVLGRAPFPRRAGGREPRRAARAGTAASASRSSSNGRSKCASSRSAIALMTARSYSFVADLISAVLPRDGRRRPHLGRHFSAARARRRQGRPATQTPATTRAVRSLLLRRTSSTSVGTGTQSQVAAVP